jgi:hypothetical protein
VNARHKIFDNQHDALRTCCVFSLFHFSHQWLGGEQGSPISSAQVAALRRQSANCAARRRGGSLDERRDDGAGE